MKERLSVRMAVEILSSRIDALCQFIIDNSLQPPCMDKQQEATLNKVLTNLRLSDLISKKDILGEASPSQFAMTSNGNCASDSNIDSAQENTEPLDTLAVGNQSQNWNWTDFDNISFNEYVRNLPVSTSEDVFPTQPTVLQTASAEEGGTTASMTETSNVGVGAEALIRQLSDRMESLKIGPGGQVRYYGPTSDFYLVDLPPPDNLTVHRTVRNDGREYLERLGLEKEADATLRAHLTNLYFTWQNPAIHIVDRAMYEAAEIQYNETQEDTPYFSEALQNAM